MKNLFITGCAAILLAACSHNAQIQTALPVVDQNVLLGVKMDPLPGKYAIYVQSGTWDSKINFSGFVCSGHHFNLAADEDFYNYFTTSLSQVVQEGIIVTEPLPPEKLAENGFDAQIAVHSNLMDPRMRVESGLFSATVVMALNASVHLVLRTPMEIVGQSTIETSQTAESDAGFACGGAGNAIGQATGAALQDLVSRTVERVYSIYGLARSQNKLIPASRTQESLPAEGGRAAADPVIN